MFRQINNIAVPTTVQATVQATAQVNVVVITENRFATLIYKKFDVDKEALRQYIDISDAGFDRVLAR